jgi:hypothetical protein
MRQLAFMRSSVACLQTLSHVLGYRTVTGGRHSCERKKELSEALRNDEGVISVLARLYKLQLGYLDVTVQEKLRSGWPGPFAKVEGCCDSSFVCLQCEQTPQLQL